MTLPTLNWKKIGPHATGGVNTVEDLLNAFDDMLTNDDYHDGSTRTPGSGSAWTHSIFQNAAVTEALYLTPPEAAVSDFRVIMAGVDSGSPSPTMEEDLFAAGKLMLGMNKGSGSFNAWDAALPFNTGAFSGYNNVIDPNYVSRTMDYVWAIESQEALVLVAEDSTGVCHGFIIGAIWDPGSTHYKDAESNGRVYSMISPGFAPLTINWDYGGFLTSDNGANDTYHHRTWLPGTKLLDRCRTNYAKSGSWVNQLTMPSGKQVLLPIMGIYFNLLDYWIGTARQIHWAFGKTGMTTVQDGGADFGHYLGGSTAAIGDVLLFLA